MENNWQIYLKKIKEGDLFAREDLIEDLMPRLYPLCLKMAGNSYDAEDCLQNALVRILEKIDSFTGKSSFYTWAYRICLNICYDYFRHKKRKKEDLWDDRQAEYPVHQADRDQAADLLEQKEAVKQIREALLSLPERYRETLILFELGDFGIKEIAGLQNIPQGTVKSRLSRGRVLLAELLEDLKIEV